MVIAGDLTRLISSATLFDLLGSKVIASLSFDKNEMTKSFLEDVTNEYYTLVQEDEAQGYITISAHDHAVFVSKVSDVTLVIAVSESNTFSDEEIGELQRFQTAVALELLHKSVRDFKNDFSAFADTHLRTPLHICFVTPAEPSDDDKSVLAVETLLGIRRQQDGEFSEVIRVGPYAVMVLRTLYTELDKRGWSEDLKSVRLFALVVSKGMAENVLIQDVVLEIRKNSSAPIIVIPSSDIDLEFARELEVQYGIDLCDAVSPRPVILLLSAMAYGGFCDMQPELALQRWEIESLVRQPPIPGEYAAFGIGHQAFFVVDRRTGEAVYSYYYNERSGLLETAPNIVAAIASFTIDLTSPAETSVFRAGNLNYITIERSEYVFTLITGSDANVEALRSRFSFLPELFLDEIPEPSEEPTDLFRSPLFTIKLLATLPPSLLPDRVAPTQKRALIWERFEHPPVRDFLEAVWYRLNGSLTIAKLAPGRGPELVLGAIHLLNRMGAIDCQLKVMPEDIPALVGTPDEEVLALYKGLDSILALVDGNLNIRKIANILGLQTSVLLTVFAELHRRMIISLTVE